jgi:hypothetical protein
MWHFEAKGGATVGSLTPLKLFNISFNIWMV